MDYPPDPSPLHRKTVEYSDASGPSLHLTWRDVECHSTPPVPYPLDWRQTRLPLICQVFEAIRALHDQPIIVTSAYRTAPHNTTLGGAHGSYHLQGLALDLRTPETVHLIPWWTEIRRRALAREGDFALLGGLGLYEWGIHVDCRTRRTDGRIAEWRG